ncbi:structural maintenance of chromosomes protein 6 [Ischnura elegans]|uniref:structural maintenance of chromosomes protein 6 n=1 Tax=Ischnura elegans TaxID=197161 RepID=UPI001ED89A3F|nr:structural maintenance of chromosomes protein 6 [Ischnura elegans]XP_046388329.1 structural maintenance of chromosomes protein 6 [Ischnura elegans]
MMGEVSRKRYHSPSQGECSKRLRDSGIDSSCGDSQEGYGYAGTIKRIELINFMCHKHLEIDLPHGVNFIIGRNGTGKSAILSALVVGLGGKASDTNRGYSLKEFVKTDEHSAVIKIVINNEGFNAFLPQVYGSFITVQRTIGPTSSQYKITSSFGNVVSTKYEDLARILMYLNLQVDNPVAILTQDTARNFLHNTKPTDKYIFFLKATRLEFIQSIYKKVADCLASTRISQEYRKRKLTSMQDEKAEIQRRLKRLMSVEKTRDKLEFAQNEYFWAKVREEEVKLEKLEESRDEQNGVYTKLNEELSLFGEKMKSFEEKKKFLEESSEAMVAEGKEINARCAVLKGACEDLNNSRKSKIDQMQSRRDEGNRLRKNIESINKQIAELQAALDKEAPMSKEEIEKCKKSLEDEKEEIEAQLRTHQHHFRQLEAALGNDVDSLHSLDVELSGINMKISQLQTTLRSLDGQGEGSLRIFGPYVVALNREIQIAFDRGIFAKKPRGPLGSYLKVKDKSWAPAVEAILGGDILRSYIVDSHKDRLVLDKLIQKVSGGAGRSPTVTATRFMDKVYDYHDSAVQCHSYPSLMDMLEVSDHVVTNCLIDLAQIETTLLVECPRAAREMMKDARNVPRNCKKVVTKSGDTYYPDPNYRCYSGDDRTQAKFLQVSVEDAKRAATSEINNCRKWAENTTSQKSTVGSRIKLHKSEIQAARKVLDELSKRKLTIRQKIMDLQENDPVDASQITFWIQERDTLKADLEKAEELFRKSKEEAQEVEADYKKMVNEYNALREESKNKGRGIDAIVSKCNNLDNKLMKAKSVMDLQIKRMNEAKKILQKMEDNISEQKNVVASCIEDALKLTKERIETKRSMAEIALEMKELKSEIERVERSEGDPKEMEEKFDSQRAKCEEMAKKINVMDECIIKMKAALRHRREVYSRCLQLLVTRMQIVFQSMIDRRRFQGGIEVDHKERKLDIKVTLRNPSPGKAKGGSKRMADSGDPKSLSGGERSFTTVAFILALWDAVELPFYALDEFDVYMDNANREITLDLLKGHADMKLDFQFVFLTPQPITSSRASSRIHVFSLESHENQRMAML